MISKDKLDQLYDYYDSREWVHPDPLEFLYDYPSLKDREIVALIASSLAYGRVVQILKSVSIILDKIGNSPWSFIKSASYGSLNSMFKDFKHRFTTGDDLVLMLLGIKHVIKKYGSLYECFLKGMNENEDSVLPPLSFMVEELRKPLNGDNSILLPLPDKGSACKKLNLFLRWMVRKDNVDPGGWDRVDPSRLIIPLDTHMHRICSMMDMTCRKGADMRTALEITKVFRKIAPEDPVKYDFALTRLGIRDDSDPDSFIDNSKSILSSS